MREEPITKTKKKPMSRRSELLITLIAIVIVYLLWNVEILSPLAYPFRLFVTYTHEAGHSLMALATGGEIRGFTVNSNGSGFATTAGGSRALILPAGYLGAAFFGAVLFFILNRFRYTRVLSVLLGVGLVVFSLLYARPDGSGVPIALIVGLIAGGGMITMGLKLSQEVNFLVLSVLAIMTALNAVLDVVLLIQYADVEMPTQRGIVRNDAAAFNHEVVGLSPEFWAFTWAALALLMMGVSVYYSILKDVDTAGREGQQDNKGKIDFSRFK